MATIPQLRDRLRRALRAERENFVGSGSAARERRRRRVAELAAELASEEDAEYDADLAR